MNSFHQKFQLCFLLNMSKKQKISESDGKKVNKYLCAFNNKWLNEENCKQWLKKVDEKTANCILCNSNFTIICRT